MLGTMYWVSALAEELMAMPQKAVGTDKDCDVSHYVKRIRVQA